LTASTKSHIPDKVKDFVKSCRAAFTFFAEKCLKVKDHNTAQIVPFTLNKPQRILHAIAEKQKAERGFVRIILDKARRFGGSTYIEGRFYWLTSLWRNKDTFIIGHEEESTKTLYRMAQIFHEMNPIAPATKKSNAQELLFDKEGNGLKSQYRLATARNLDAGRSQGVHNLHISEEAYWPDGAERLLSSLLSCVPMPGSGVATEVFRESTANGFGNTFQEDVFKSYAEGKYPYYQENGVPYAWGSPSTDWILVFIPWFAYDKYEMKFDNEIQRREFRLSVDRKVLNTDTMSWEDSEARKLETQFSLSLKQLHWRQWTIDNTCRGSIDMFHQEFPSTVIESFLTSGSNVYSKELCDLVEAACKPPILIGDLVERLSEVKIRPNPHGKFQLWHKPQKDGLYFLTVDSAGGIKPSHELTNKEPDPSCIDVYDRETGVQMAQWHGHIDYGEIHRVVEMVGNLFNRALAVVELNNHGYTVVKDLDRVRYPLYEAKEGEPGWITNRVTKVRMVDSLREAAKDGALQIRCRETVAEMRTFIETKSGAFGAASGCHDERVDTAGIAAEVIGTLPHREEKKESVGFHSWANRNKTQYETHRVMRT
jgi:hypothetical protein